MFGPVGVESNPTERALRGANMKFFDDESRNSPPKQINKYPHHLSLSLAATPLPEPSQPPTIAARRRQIISFLSPKSLTLTLLSTPEEASAPVDLAASSSARISPPGSPLSPLLRSQLSSGFIIVKCLIKKKIMT